MAMFIVQPQHCVLSVGAMGICDAEVLYYYDFIVIVFSIFFHSSVFLNCCMTCNLYLMQHYGVPVWGHLPFLTPLSRWVPSCL